MCLWDNKAGRQQETLGRAAAQVVFGTPVPLWGADPNRTTLAVSVDQADVAVSVRPVLIRAGSATGPVLAAVSAHAPAVVLRTTDFGDGILQSIWATCGDATGLLVNSSVVRFNLPLEDL